MDQLDSLQFNVPERRFVANSFSIFHKNPGIVPKGTDLWNDVIYAYMYEPFNGLHFLPLDPEYVLSYCNMGPIVLFLTRSRACLSIHYYQTTNIATEMNIGVTEKQ